MMAVFRFACRAFDGVLMLALMGLFPRLAWGRAFGPRYTVPLVLQRPLRDPPVFNCVWSSSLSDLEAELFPGIF